MSDYIHGTRPEEQARLTALNRLTNPAFLDFLEIGPCDRVLEVGSGLGILAAEVGQRASQGFVVGVEHSMQQIAAVGHVDPNLRFVQGDAHSLPFRAGQFDMVYCRYVLEHISDPPGALDEICRVLRRGGRLFVMENDITVNRFDPPCPTFDRLWSAFVGLQSSLGGDGTIGRRLFGLLKRAGFRDIQLSYQPEVHWSGLSTFRPWVINLLGNVEGARQKLISSGLASAEDLVALRNELDTLMNRDDASALFHWNRARASK